MFKQNKVLSLFLSVMMIFSIMSVFNVSVFAVTENDFNSIEDDSSSKKSVLEFRAGEACVGEEIEITLSAKNMVGLESADLQFEFDEEFFEFVSIKSADKRIDMSVGGKTQTNKFHFQLMFLESATADMDLCVITLNVLKTGMSEITVACAAWDRLPETPENACIKITATNKTSYEEETTSEKDTADKNENSNDADKDATCKRCGDIHNNIFGNIFCLIRTFFLRISDFFKSFKK